ncbi:metallophosphoesterase [Paenibacillus sp. LMG 31456]|uniref:Metallophosphoesterase n=1 Tax=Paenibacillus foliorum TaxID=2654974 RepID=A0A972K1W9_9BACL|nr:metallophosphoesterase [Paenibacillus foliorum]NOU97119.1 metallophosphoesterase [Paenibacillus foliorum]
MGNKMMTLFTYKTWLSLLILAFILLTGCMSNAPLPQTAPPSTEATAPKHIPDQAADTPYRFVVMGDSRGSSNGTNETTLRALMENIKKLSPLPQFILFTGDQVSGGSDVGKQLADWKNIVDDYYPITSMYPTLGNHEHDEAIFTQSFPTLPKEQLPGYGKTVYSFDYGNARFITLNSDRLNAKMKYIIEKEQLDWLENQLKTSNKTHTFVQFHVPAYPVGAHLGSSLDGDPASRDALWSILDKYKVSVVFVGHEHNYNRRLVDSAFNGSGYQFKNKIYQLTVGGAGAPLYSGNKENKQVVVGPKASYHYMVVDVDGAKLNFKAYDLQQNEIDSFTVER